MDLQRRRKERLVAKDIVEKLAQAAELAQTEMAAAQQRMEESANRHRDAAYNYQVGDKVWLDLRNIHTDRPSKKLDYRHAKFTVLEKVGTHAYRLDVNGKYMMSSTLPFYGPPHKTHFHHRNCPTINLRES